MAQLRQVVFAFGEGDEKSRNPRVRGGKGASLALLAANGLPVPPGFTITTSVGRAWLDEGVFPKRLDWQMKRGLDGIEKRTGRHFSDPGNPLLLSVRSGARTSMPGMMDTVLNVGISEDVYSTLAKAYGKRFARECRKRLFEGLGGKVADPFDQLMHAIRYVLESWKSDRAYAYRNLHDIAHWEGTAVNVQAMVFGNADDNSCTGVVFSHNPDTAEEVLFGEFLPRSQGEDLVSGRTNPLPIAELADWNAEIYTELAKHVATIRELYDDMIEVEFTVESGKLWILQARPSKGSPAAAATFAVREVWAKKIDKVAAVRRLSRRSVSQLRQSSIVAVNGVKSWHGTPVSAGAAVGRLAFSASEAKELAAGGVNVILARPSTVPDDLPGMIVAKAIVTGTGGLTCHASVVARSLGIPAVVGVKNFDKLSRGEFSLDGASGVVYEGSLPIVESKTSKEIDIFMRWYKKFVGGERRLNFALLSNEFLAVDLVGDFYLAEAMELEARGTSLEDCAFELKNRVHQRVAEILACYLTVAVAGELRHGRDVPTFMPSGALESFRSDAQKSVVDLLRGMTVGEQTNFFETASRYFAEGTWHQGFGGKKWAEIASAVVSYLNESVPITVFADRVFDLRHNGNQLFDKHTMILEYGMYGRRTNVYKLLEVKGRTNSASQLFDMIQRDVVFSGDVTELFEAGEREGVWK